MTPKRTLTLGFLVLLIFGLIYLVFNQKTSETKPKATPAPTVGGSSAKAASGAYSPPRRSIEPQPAQLSQASVEKDDSLAVGVLSGRVLSVSTGEGVGGAELSFERNGVFFSVTTDASGGFVFSPKEAGVYSLAMISAEDYLPYAPDPSSQRVSFTTRPGYRINDLTFSLTPAIEYLGVVLTQDGTPVEGASIRLFGAEAGEQALSGLASRFTSDAKGEFHFNAPDEALLEARKDGFAPGRALLDGPAQISHRLEIRLGAPGGPAPSLQSLQGKVIDPNGKPIAGARVLAIPDPGLSAKEKERKNSSQTTSGPDGSFTLSELDPILYQVVASFGDFAPAIALGTPGGEPLLLTLSSGGRLSGHVTAGGKPVAAATVLVLRSEGLKELVTASASVIDAEGFYEVRGLEAGTYQVLAVAAGYAPSPKKEVTIALPPAPDAVADLSLSVGGSLSGVVLDEDTKKPLENAKATVESGLSGGAGVLPIYNSVATDAEGRFTLRGIPPGKRSVVVAAFAHNAQILSGLEVKEGEALPPVTVELSATKEGEAPTTELFGVGAALEAGEDALIVSRVIPGGGAEEAGIVAGDSILQVDGMLVASLGLQGSIEQIRGPLGTIVELTVRKKDSQQVLVVPTKRKKIRT